MIKKDRPPAKSRFGSVIERIFGTTNTQFLYNLKGNTQVMKNVREVTKSVDPANHAVWTHETLGEALQRFLFEEYDTKSHPALGESPRDAFTRGLAEFGTRPFRLIPYTEKFIFSTLPTTAKGTATVIRSRGIKIRHIYYWCFEFTLAGVPGSKVPVRFDPFDIGIAYAFVDKRWVKCLSEYYVQLAGVTEVELQAITNEITKSKSNHGKDYKLNAQKIAAFIEELKSKEKSLRAQQLAAEMKPAQKVSVDKQVERCPSRRQRGVEINASEIYEDLV